MQVLYELTETEESADGAQKIDVTVGKWRLEGFDMEVQQWVA